MSDSFRAVACGGEEQYQANVHDVLAMVERLKADDAQRTTVAQSAAAVAGGKRILDSAPANATPLHQHPQALPMPLASAGDWPPLKAK